MVSVYWLIAGAVLLGLEAFGLPGIGFLFAGLAAIAVGVLVEAGLIDALAYVTQAGIFLLTATVLALLLWRKLKTWRLDPSSPHYSNMLGTEAIVTEALAGETIGTVRWSGTLMRARLMKGGAETAPVGSTVVVQAVEGNLLTVVAK